MARRPAAICICESPHQFGLTFDDVRGRSRKSQSSDVLLRNRGQPDHWVKGLGAASMVFYRQKESHMQCAGVIRGFSQHADLESGR